MTTTRVITAAACALLAGLVAAAVALSTGGTPTAAIDPAHLRVGRGVPTTATARLTYRSSTGVTLTATVALDGVTDGATITVDASNGLVEGALEARAVGGVLYVDVSQFASQLGAPWASLALPRVHDAAGVALRELREPDLARLRSLGAVTTRTATGTLTVLHLPELRLPPLGSLPLGLPSAGEGILRVTTGPKGQVLALSLTVVGRDHVIHVTATLQLTGYDQPVHLAAPPASQVTRLTSRSAAALFGSDARALDRLLGDLGAPLHVRAPRR